MPPAPAVRRTDRTAQANRRLAAGTAVSLLLHALVLSLQFGIAGLRPGSPTPITVTLSPAPPPAIPAPSTPLPETAPRAAPVIESPPRAPGGLRLVDPIPPAAAPAPRARPSRPKRSAPRRQLRSKATLAQAVIAQVNKPEAAFTVPLPLPDIVAAAPVEPSPDPVLAATTSETTPATATGDAGTPLEEAQQVLADDEGARDEAERAAAQQQRMLAQQEAQAQGREQQRLLAEQRLEAQRRVQEQSLAEGRERYAQQRLQEQERLLAQQREQEAEQVRQRLDEQRLAAQRQAEELRVQEQERQLAQQRLESERRAYEQAAQERRQAEALRQRELEELAARQQAQRLALQQREEERRQAEEAAQRLAEQLRRRAAEELARRQAEQQDRMQAQQSAQQAAQPALAQPPADSPGTGAGRAGAAAGNAAGPGNSNGGGALPKSVLGSDVANRARELMQGITVPGAAPPVVRPAEHARQARRAVVDGSERDVPLRLYIDSVRQKIERNAALGSVRGASLGVSIEPLVSIVLRSDGSVDDVTIVRSSGRADTDEAVRQIVRLNARYSAFPPNVAARYDVIEFRRIWAFAEGLKLREEAR